jgi:hypothetical protein
MTDASVNKNRAAPRVKAAGPAARHRPKGAQASGPAAESKD